MIMESKKTGVMAGEFVPHSLIVVQKYQIDNISKMDRALALRDESREECHVKENVDELKAGPS
jgi:hypothetical protein